jgi:hypothetical protein
MFLANHALTAASASGSTVSGRRAARLSSCMGRHSAGRDDIKFFAAASPRNSFCWNSPSAETCRDYIHACKAECRMKMQACAGPPIAGVHHEQARAASPGPRPGVCDPQTGGVREGP